MRPIPNPAKAFSQPCGCGMPAGEPCPHTPLRCPHDWRYSKAGEVMTYTHMQPDSDKRACVNCGRVERAELSWRTEVA